MKPARLAILWLAPSHMGSEPGEQTLLLELLAAQWDSNLIAVFADLGNCLQGCSQFQPCEVRVGSFASGRRGSFLLCSWPRQAHAERSFTSPCQSDTKEPREKVGRAACAQAQGSRLPRGRDWAALWLPWAPPQTSLCLCVITGKVATAREADQAAFLSFW